MKTGIELIAEERERQINSLGWDEANDDVYKQGELPIAAYVYTGHAIGVLMGLPRQPKTPRVWPWPEYAWNPSGDPVKDLVKAGALIAAEIDRINRAKEARDWTA